MLSDDAMGAGLRSFCKRHRLLSPRRRDHARRIILHAAERSLDQIANAVHEPHAADAAFRKCDLCRLLGHEFWLGSHNGASGAGLRQLVTRPLPFVHIFHAGQDHGLHKALDKG